MQEEALRILAEGEIESCEPIPRGSNYTFSVGVRLGDSRATAVYKPRRGERPLWDFPAGTLYLREYAAFVTSQALGWPFIPATVLREGPFGVGSVQLFVDAEPLPSIRALQDLYGPDLARVAAFDIVANNADRKGGHVLRDAGGKLWGIDHGLCFNVVPKVRTVLLHYCGQEVPAAVLDELKAFREDLDRARQWEEGLKGVIAREEIEAFWGRLDWVLQRRVYPALDPYHSVPWPPF